MSKNPKVLLVIDQERDIDNAIGFLKYEKDEQFLGWFFRDESAHILDKSFTTTRKRNDAIRKYVRDTHAGRKKEIRAGLLAAKRDWKQIEEDYFSLVGKIFKGHPWPKGKYVGAISVFRLYPRYLDKKLFFFPYSYRIPRFSNCVIAHEMLHFMFFDYIFSKYKLGEDSKIKGKSVDYVWQISEVFNVVIEGWRPYREIVGHKGRPYPGHEQIYGVMRRQWMKNQDIDWLLDQWFGGK